MKNSEIKAKEIQNIMKNGINKGYLIRNLKRWNKEAETIATRPKNDIECSKVYRSMMITGLDDKVRKILRPNGVGIVSSKQGTLLTYSEMTKTKEKKQKLRESTKYP